MRILGIDPGSRYTGYGIIDAVNNKYSVIDYGVLVIKPLDFSFRLQQIFEELSEIIQTQKPDAMAIEQVFVAKNPSSALKLGHARGAAMLAGSVSGLHAAEYSALQIKKAVVGHGRADKAQMQKMIMLLLGLKELPQSDAADALSIALCHGQSYQLLNGLMATETPLGSKLDGQLSGLSYRRGRLRKK